MSTFLWTVFILIGLVLIVFSMDRDGFWSRFFGAPDLGNIEFAELKNGDKPNEALACPPGYCPGYENSIETKIYKTSPSELLEKLDETLEGDASVVRVDNGSDPLKRRYVTRSPLMRYPDTVSIEAFAANEGQSKIAMFARAQLGYSDMGANRARLKNWLKRLEPFTAGHE